MQESAATYFTPYTECEGFLNTLLSLRGILRSEYYRVRLTLIINTNDDVLDRSSAFYRMRSVAGAHISPVGLTQVLVNFFYRFRVELMSQ